MNFIFCDQKYSLPKYALGNRPYVINVAKILSSSNSSSYADKDSYTFALNMMLLDEFLFAFKNKKSSIVYINKELSSQLICNIKKTLIANDVKVKKYFACVSSQLPEMKMEVDSILTVR
jgi:hypothetical protein